MELVLLQVGMYGGHATGTVTVTDASPNAAIIRTRRAEEG